MAERRGPATDEIPDVPRVRLPSTPTTDESDFRASRALPSTPTIDETDFRASRALPSSPTIDETDFRASRLPTSIRNSVEAEVTRSDASATAKPRRRRRGRSGHRFGRFGCHRIVRTPMPTSDHSSVTWVSGRPRRTITVRSGSDEISNTAPATWAGARAASSSPRPRVAPARRPDGRRTQPSATNTPIDTAATATMIPATTTQPHSRVDRREVLVVHAEEAGDQRQRQHHGGVDREHLGDLGRLARLGATVRLERLGQRRSRRVEPGGGP